MATDMRGALRQALTAAVALLLSACAVGPDFHRPSLPSEAGAAGEPLPAAEFEAGAAVPDEWWQALGSPSLDEAVRVALGGNATLAAALASLRASEEARRAGYGVFLPHVDAAAVAQRERSAPALAGAALPSGVFNLYTATATVGYSLDLFGGLRRGQEVLAAQSDQARAEARAVHLALTGNVVNAVVARAAYQEELAATQALVAAADDQVHVAQVRAEAGVSTYMDLLSLQAERDALKTQIPALQTRVDQADNLLAMLSGRTPAQGSAPAIALAGLNAPAILPVPLPAEVVRQRPDVQVAEAQLHAATARVGVATAALLPDITLSGLLGSAANRGSELGTVAARYWIAGGVLTVPLFEGGSRWHARGAAQAAREASLALYRQVVLTAFEQVGDSLRALQHDADLLRTTADAQDSARGALALVQANYDAGTTDYAALLAAMRQFQTARIARIQAEAQHLQGVVALYLAIGGGVGPALGPPSRQVLPVAMPKSATP
jgi:NodT family efflux transporter outer membrane factor (OMF) lipoprotein